MVDRGLVRGCARLAGCRKGSLQFVQEVVQGRDAFLQAFALARLGHHLAGATGAVERVSRQDLPVVKHALWEGLATRVGPQVSGEACRKGQGQGSLGSPDLVPASSLAKPQRWGHLGTHQRSLSLDNPSRVRH